MLGGASDIDADRADPKQWTTSPTKLCAANDVVLCIRATIGKPIVVEEQYCLGRGVAGFTPLACTSQFLCQFFVLNSDALASLGTGSTFRTVNKSILNGFAIGLPPLPEQRRIVAKIESLQARTRSARASLEAVGPLLDQFRRSVLAAAFRGDLTADWRAAHPDTEPASELLKRIRAERRRRWEEAELAKMQAKGKTPKDDAWKKKYKEPEPVDTTDLPELPEGWCWATAEEVVEPLAEIVYGIVQPGPEIANGVPYVRAKDIQDGKILVAELRRTSQAIADRYERASLLAGDVLLGIIRATKVVIVPEGIDGANITQGTARLRPSSVISSTFLAAWLESDFAQAWLHGKYRGIDMPGLNLRDVRRLPVPLAPQPEQSTVCKSVQALQASHNAMKRVLAESAQQIDNLSQSILAKAFRGELVPQDPDDEPASVLLERIRAEREAAAANPRAKREPNKKAAKKSAPRRSARP